MTDDSFRITTYRAAATVQVADGGELRGEFSCRASSPEHPGRETITDLLNEPSRFVPFFPDDGSERPVLLNKNLIAVVIAGDRDAARRTSIPPVAELDEQRSVSLMLAGGEEIEGALRVTGPEGQTRTQDSLNAVRSFVALETAGGVVVVNLAQVLIVADLEQE